MARQIEQRGADRAGGAYDENRGAQRQVAAAGQHLKGREIRKRDAHRFGRIDTLRDWHEEARWANCILGIAADDTQISDHLTLRRCGHAGTHLLDDTNNLVARSERERSLEVRITAAPNHGIGEAGAGGEYLDANLPRAGIGDSRLLRHLQDFGTAKPRDAQVLPRHYASISACSVCVERHARTAPPSTVWANRSGVCALPNKNELTCISAAPHRPAFVPYLALVYLLLILSEVRP